MSSISPNRPERQIGPSRLDDLETPAVGGPGRGAPCDPGALQDRRANARTVCTLMTAVSTDEVTRYERDGYLSPLTVLDPGRVAEYRQELRKPLVLHSKP